MFVCFTCKFSKNVFDINKRQSDIWKQYFVTVGDK